MSNDADIGLRIVHHQHPSYGVGKACSQYMFGNDPGEVKVEANQVGKYHGGKQDGGIQCQNHPAGQNINPC